MKTIIIAAVSIILIPSIVAAKDPEGKNKVEGLWYSKTDECYIEFQAGGTLNFYMPEDRQFKASWSQDPKDGKIHYEVALFGQKASHIMELKFDGENKAEFEIKDGESHTYTRSDGKLNPDQFIGQWKGQYKDKETGVTEHLLQTWSAGGKAKYQSLAVSDKHKIYCLDEGKYQWRITADYLIETYDAGTDDELISPFTAKFIKPDTLKYKYVFAEDDIESEVTRIKNGKLPEPPKDYKKLSPDEFWERCFEAIEEEIIEQAGNR